MKNGGFENDIKIKIMKWRETLGILYEDEDAVEVKGTFYKTVVRPTNMVGSE